MNLAGTITDLRVFDVRFPTSAEKHGSDAMNPDPDYSAAYAVVETDRADGISGHGLAFTIGRGTEVVVAAIHALRPLVVGHAIEEFVAAPGEFCKTLTGDSQLRWLGPEKGVIHMATAAVVNALWDLWAKLDSKPLWKLLSDLSPSRIVELVDWRYLTDALTPREAERALDRWVPTRAARERELRRAGYPAYTTSVGWLGYSDERLRALCREGIRSGFERFKLKVGQNVDDDRRRTAIAREEIGPRNALFLDANQRWDVAQAIEWTRALAGCNPTWIEEPTSPDDVMGHAAIARALEPLGIGVATGEHCPNRVVFKQLMQARAIAFCQVDFCRLAGVNEVVAVQLLASHFGIPVCPHAGGVGLCEYVQHASIFDYIAVSGALDGRCIEYVDHLHEHFVDPCVVRDGRYRIPMSAGTGITMKPESLAAYSFPNGPVWKNLVSS
ncbi:MAG TPA: enolase C-terminal domain-like protein [Polyangiaceae bacterium]|nr:enolase C-terminal domain-like protein [Polyangiaceae bacterium]